jgi:hypothetical protein
MRAAATAALRFAVGCALVLLVVEGASSLVLLLLELAAERPGVAERRHTRFDPELGWSNVPGVRIPDMYGPGIGLTVNAQGFRGAEDVEPQVPEGRVRVVCSGDSFTLGYGVADDETWCARLAARDPRLETVNMGQGGYGIDQAWLWYRRDGATLEHRIHVFAFIRVDFGRMLDDEFLGYGKPLLVLEDGELALRNVPVPRGAYRLPWLVERRGSFARMRSVQLFAPLLRREPELPGPEPVDLRELAVAVFEALARENARKGSELVLVHLPMREDHRDPSGDAMRRFVREAAGQRGIHFVDLVAALRRLPPARVEALYLGESSPAFLEAAGHLSAEGNEWVARQLYRRLAALAPLRVGPTP